jgi:hypothetical protein
MTGRRNTLKQFERTRDDDEVRVYLMRGDAGDELEFPCVVGTAAHPRIAAVISGRVRWSFFGDGILLEQWKTGPGETRNTRSGGVAGSTIVATCLEDGTAWSCTQYKSGTLPAAS